MNDKNFDKEISLLYQQRKQEISAPEVNLSKIKTMKVKRYGLLQVISILFFGGAASFGILAFMNHLIEQKSVEAEQEQKMLPGVVELTEPSADIVINKSVLIAMKKPPVIPIRREQHDSINKPAIASEQTPALSFDEVDVMPSKLAETSSSSLVPLYQNLDKSLLNASNTNHNVQAIFRAKAKYPIQARRDNIEGWVQLAFDINEVGNVENVSIIDSKPKRIFNKAARKALVKWKYQVILVDGKPVVHKNRSIQLNFQLEDKNNDRSSAIRR